MEKQNLKNKIAEAAQNELSRRSYFEFLKYMFPLDVTWGWHHEYIANTLQDFVEGGFNRLMIFMPPQHGKTTLMTEYLPAWDFGKDPNRQTILTMYDGPQAQKYNRKYKE